MKNYQTIKLSVKDKIATIELNRPEIRNAINELMVNELIDCLGAVEIATDAKIVIIRGNGKSFCAGADLNWLRDVKNYTYEENYNESLQLAKCFYKIYTLKKPTIAVVHGAAIGGANGILAACDFVYCADDTVFSLSEVKIGLVPACISPYIIKRVGEFNSKELILTGKRFNGKDAEKFGLVNESAPEEKLDDMVRGTIKLLLNAGPNALQQSKYLLDNVINNLTITEAIELTAKVIADIRLSDEAQEGMSAFLEKRKPSWSK